MESNMSITMERAFTKMLRAADPKLIEASPEQYGKPAYQQIGEALDAAHEAKKCLRAMNEIINDIKDANWQIEENKRLGEDWQERLVGLHAELREAIKTVRGIVDDHELKFLGKEQANGQPKEKADEDDPKQP